MAKGGSDVSDGSSVESESAVCALTLAGCSYGVQGSILPSSSTHPASSSISSGWPPSLWVLVDTLRPSHLESPVYANGTNHALLSFQDISSSEHPSLFLRKVSLCSVLFDFTDPSKNLREKEIKGQTLSELVDYVSTGTAKLDKAMVEECFEMIRANIFRAMPTVRRNDSGNRCRRGSGVSRALMDAEAEGPFQEPAWPHLQLVYDILLHYVDSDETDPKVAQQYINRSLVLLLIELFDSKDARERDLLKTILLKIYRKFVMHRPFIRKSIKDIFYHVILETERHNGIAQFLEIWGSIISGFAVPLKEEHKQSLGGILIPLLKPKCLAMYHDRLTYCITLLVKKDFRLADMVIRGLLKYWPVISSQKELLFLGTLEEVLNLTQPAEFRQCMIPLFKRLARCLSSSHVRVAGYALCFWEYNQHFASLVSENRQVILPLIFPALEGNTSHHWSLAVKSLTSNVRKIFQDLDQDLFQECQRLHYINDRDSEAANQSRGGGLREMSSEVHLGLVAGF